MAQTRKSASGMLHKIKSSLITYLNSYTHLESLFSDDTPNIDEDNMMLRLDSCRKFGKRYTRDMMILMGIVFAKRMLLEPFRGFHSL